MKKGISKVLVLVIILMLSITSFSTFKLLKGNSISNDDNEIIINYDFDLQFESINLGIDNYTRIKTLNDCKSVGDPGEPILPILPCTVLIPYNEEISYIEVTRHNEIVTFLPSRSPLIEPGQQMYPLDYENYMDDISNLEIGVTGPKSEIYESSSVYPGKDYSIVRIDTYRGYRIARLNLYPVQYMPTENRISYSTSMQIKISTDPIDDIEIKNSNLYRGLAEDIDSVIHKVDNPASISSYPTTSTINSSVIVGSLDYFTSSQNFGYVIITNEELKNSNLEFNFQALRDMWTSSGLNTTIVTVEDIKENYFGSDTQDKIRNFIKHAYNNWNTQYVLLGGDDDIIPTRTLYFGPSRYGPVYGPSDLYYACLDEDGPGGVYDDLEAEVYIGRAPAGNINEVSNFVKKTISYMTTQWGNDEYLNNALWVGEILFNNPVTWGADYKNELLGGSSAYGYTTVGIPLEDDLYNVDIVYDKDWEENGWPEAYISNAGIFGGWPKNEVIDRLNIGTHLINHLGHGNKNYAMKMYNQDVNSLTNDNYFFLYSQTCFAGYFDDFDCFAEYITVKNIHGAFAAVMNSRFGWGSGGNTNGPSQYFDREFWDAIFGENITELGRANQDSKEDNLHLLDTSQFGILMRFCYLELNLFGDPALGIKCAANPGSSFQNIPPTSSLVSPSDGINGVDVMIPLKVEVFDLNRDSCDVYFYDASDDSLIRKFSGVESGDTVKAWWFGLEHGTTHSWYVVVDDSMYQPEGRNGSEFVSVSDVYSFTTIADPNAPAETWWDNDWEKRKPIITKTEDTSISKFNISINIYYEAGMQLDYRDLRFVSYDDDITEFNYWINEEETDENSAEVWIQVKNCTVYSIDRAFIWMYFCNDDAESISNISFFIEDSPVKIWGLIPSGKSESSCCSSSWSKKVIVDSEHNIVIAGQITDSFDDPRYLIVKLDPNGKRLWNREYRDIGESGDHITDVVIDSDDNVIVTGYSDDDISKDSPIGHCSTVGGSGYDFFTIKLGPDGRKIWEKRAGGKNGEHWTLHYTGEDEDNHTLSGDNIPSDYEWQLNVPPQFYARAVTVDSRNNVIVVGDVQSVIVYQVLLVVYSPEGELLFPDLSGYEDRLVDGWSSTSAWYHNCIIDAHAHVTDVEVDSNDDIIISGTYTDIHGGGWDNFEDDAFIIKYHKIIEGCIGVDVQIWNENEESENWVDYLDLTNINDSIDTNLKYKINSTNRGFLPLYDINILDSLSRICSYNNDANIQISNTLNGNISWFIDTIDVGESKEIIYTVAITSASLKDLEENVCDYHPETVIDPEGVHTSYLLLIPGSNVTVTASCEKGDLRVNDSADLIIGRSEENICWSSEDNNRDVVPVEEIFNGGNKLSSIACTDVSNTPIFSKIFDGGFDDTCLGNRDQTVYSIDIDEDDNIAANTDFGIILFDTNGDIISQKIENQPPIPKISTDEIVTPIVVDNYATSGVAILTGPSRIVTVDALSSCDPDGEIISYKWYIEDYKIARRNYCTMLIGTEPTCEFMVPYTGPNGGLFKVTLEVEDNSGVKSSKVIYVNIDPDPIRMDPDYQGGYSAPDDIVIFVNESYMAEIGQSVRFEGNIVFYYDYGKIPGHNLLSDNWIWDFGDGATSKVTKVTSSVLDNKVIFRVFGMYNYSKKGYYEVTLKQIDGDEEGDPVHGIPPAIPTSKPFPASTYVKIHGSEPEPPVAIINADVAPRYQTVLGNNIFFDALNSYDLDGVIRPPIKWDFGDGTTDWRPIPEPHMYEREQNYYVNLTVQDNDHLMDTSKTEITMEGWKGVDFFVFNAFRGTYGYSGGGISLDSLGHMVLYPGNRHISHKRMNSGVIGSKRISEIDSNYDVISTIYTDSDVAFAHLTTDSYYEDAFRSIITCGHKGNYIGNCNGGLYIAKYSRCNLTLHEGIKLRLGEEYTKDGAHETPLLSYNPLFHNFGDKDIGESDSVIFEIWNSGVGTLTYELSESAPWVELSLTSGESTGEHDDIRLSIDTAELSDGFHSYDVLISSNSENGKFTVSVNIINDLPPIDGPSLSITPDSYNFGNMVINKSETCDFNVQNIGSDVLNYSLTSEYNWVIATPNSGNSTGEQDTITLRIDTTNLSLGINQCIININSNGGNKTFTITVKIVEETPEIIISNPEPGNLYLQDKELFKPAFLKDKILIIGQITIKANVIGYEAHRFEFYIDDALKNSTCGESFQYTWNEKVFGLHTIKTIAYDSNNSKIATKELEIIIFNFGFFKREV